MVHVLTPRDMKRRTVMAKEFLRRMAENPAWINDVWFTDESHCYLSGRVNKTHCIFWGSSKPDYVLERPLHSVKCTVWMAISARGVIGPFFFEDDLGKAQTVILGSREEIRGTAEASKCGLRKPVVSAGWCACTHSHCLSTLDTGQIWRKCHQPQGGV